MDVIPLLDRAIEITTWLSVGIFFGAGVFFLIKYLTRRKDKKKRGRYI